MEESKKTRVAMICHVSNKEIRSNLSLRSRKMENFLLRKLFSKGAGYIDFAKWNVNIINGLSHQEDMELFVISPHVGLNKRTQQFQKDGVHYCFFRGTPLFPFDLMDRVLKICQKNNYKQNRKIIASFVKSIKPDIVLLVGAENPYYSISALDIDNIPVFLQCQTVYANPDRKKLAGYIDQYRWDTEVQLFHKIPYYACSGAMYYNLIKEYNPQAVVFRRRWPQSPFPSIEALPKQYDFVFFAHYLSKKKGFDNAIEAIAIAAQRKPDIKVLAIGSFDKDKKLFLDRINELGIAKNIEFHAPLAEYEDLLRCVTQARFALLPIKIDVLSGTIHEALRLGLPIVTCKTSGTPSLNKDFQTVLISDVGDNQKLAQHMIDLMDDAELVQQLKTNMQMYLAKRVSIGEDNLKVFVKQMYAVIHHFYNGVPIPQEQLFHPN